MSSPKSQRKTLADRGMVRLTIDMRKEDVERMHLLMVDSHSGTTPQMVRKAMSVMRFVIDLQTDGKKLWWINEDGEKETLRFVF